MPLDEHGEAHFASPEFINIYRMFFVLELAMNLMMPINMRSNIKCLSVCRAVMLIGIIRQSSYVSYRNGK